MTTWEKREDGLYLVLGPVLRGGSVEDEWGNPLTVWIGDGEEFHDLLGLRPSVRPAGHGLSPAEMFRPA